MGRPSTLPSVRVIAGSCRGRLLRAPVGAAIRPTSDRVREAMFDVLCSLMEVADSHVADLFAGTGALGIEALSRGATRAYFVDADPACLAAARANLKPLQLPGEAQFVHASLPDWRVSAHVDLVIADPPYGPLDVDRLLEGIDAKRALIENDRYVDAPEGWEVAKTKRYGTTLVTMLEPSPPEGP